MVTTSIQSIILAAGKSTRFRTGKSKMLEKLCGQEMILYQTQLFKSLNLPFSLVLEHQSDEIKSIVMKHHPTSNFIHQDNPQGTGDAVLRTKNTWYAEHILVINGDMPLITKEIINQLVEKHIQTQSNITIVTACNPDPSVSGYGRVFQDENGMRIVEEKDYQHNHHEVCCINAGIYIFKKSFLEYHIDLLKNINAAREYYLTDLINIAYEKNIKIEHIVAPFDSVRGINTLKELWAAEQIKRSDLIKYWMLQGVRFISAQSVVIDHTVAINSGTTIGAGVHLLGKTVIGESCNIGPFSILENSVIEDYVTIHPHSVISQSTIKKQAQIGPFCHIRNYSTIEHNAHLGNFVETTKTIVGSFSKAKHLTYLGNCTIGENVNIGAGTIVCNYDGHKKHETYINDQAFIGSNNTLIAPLTIDKNSFTAAGSVITENVPENALAISRSKQTNKEDYMKKKEHKNPPKNNIDQENKILFFAAKQSIHETITEQ